MKNAKRPTRAQKEIISNHGLNAMKWLVLEETEFGMLIVHKESNKKKRINKFSNTHSSVGKQSKCSKQKTRGKQDAKELCSW